jgi:methyltransferase (TIGR00027 family)
MGERAASRTAVLVCQGRAVAHGRIAPGKFDDPTALPLLRDGERGPVERARTGTPPRGWRARIEYELQVVGAEGLVLRTVAVDDAVRAVRHPQVVILGAGLDGRAWRLPELAGATVFEVDHPASQADKRERAEALGPFPDGLRFVPVDLAADPLAPALEAAGHDVSRPTTWVWEGVVAYLTPAEVSATTRTVAALSAAGSRLVVTYPVPSRSAALGRTLARALLRLAARQDPMASEPRRSTWTPAVMRDVLEGAGFAVATDDGLVDLARGLGITIAHHRAVVSSRVAVADLRPASPR